MGCRGRTMLAAGAAASVGASLFWRRRHHDDRPYGPRWVAEAPRPGISRKKLAQLLSAQSGERVLEVGPGYGYYSVTIARALAPGGTLELLDVRQTLLDQTVARTAEEGLANVRATLGDGRRLPFPDGGFDAAYLVACLGETPDPEAAVRELARVLRPGGRLVVGETVADPHRIRPPALAEMAQAAGLRAGATVGRKSYFARFDKPDAT